MTINTINQSSFSPILEGQHNFRDLGGLPAGNGFMLRTGMIYRSGDLSSITDNDIAVLENIGITLVIDFRSERERINRPNRVIRSVKETRNIAINDSAREKAMEYITQNDAAGLESVLQNDYRRIIRENQEEYRQFFHELAFSPHLPVVFHCVAGKDRTGLAAVFLLTALGVEFDLVFKDYIASVIRNAALTTKLINKINEKGHNGEIIRPLLEVKKEYLDAALTEIRENHGDLHTFVINTLKADEARLQERFLEPVNLRT
jgi:protein-tyrosine phosphatase